MREKKGKKWILTVLFAVLVLSLVCHTTIKRADAKSMLSKELYICRELVNTAERGIHKGAYPEAAADTFAEQVEKAAAVLSDMDASEEEVQQALSELKAAKEQFQNAVNTEDGTEALPEQTEATQPAKQTKHAETAAETEKETELETTAETGPEKTAAGSLAAETKADQSESEQGSGSAADDRSFIPDTQLKANAGGGAGGTAVKKENKSTEKEEKQKADQSLTLDLTDKKTETQPAQKETSAGSSASTEKETTAPQPAVPETTVPETSAGDNAAVPDTPASERPAQSETTAPETEKQKTCTITIRCETILNNMDNLREGLAGYVPANGILLPKSKIQLYDGETVFDVLKRVTRATGLKLEFRNDGVHGSGYIVGINHLNELDCGSGSGWMYTVNGWFPNYGCSKYVLKDGDIIQWIYTCDLGRDINGNFWE